MRSEVRFLCMSAAISLPLICNASEKVVKRPNILFCLADDVSFPHFGTYGCRWVRTPNCDWVAEQGLKFLNAYTPNAKSAPSRSCILTGHYSWQLEEAANHFPFFPAKFKTVTEALRESGYYVGQTGKGWSPGDPGKIDGKPRQLIGQSFDKHKLTAPTKEISDNDYAANFEDFLSQNRDREPFFFWFGSLEPHRGYEYGTGVERGGYKTADIDRVPSFWPDCDSVRNDMLDYALELEHFDTHVGRMINTLKRENLLENTIIIITADNGMPFPYAKGQAYHSSNHLPMVVMWAGAINSTGHAVEDYVSFVDLSPTFLELAQIDINQCGMQHIEGRSITPLFYSGKRVTDKSRNFAIIGKERHDIGRPNDEGYPIRGIKTDEYLYIYNFEPDRWPVGDPQTGYLNCDGGATKSVILSRQMSDPLYWQRSFGKRPQEELYDMKTDPECMNNLAEDVKLSKVKKELKSRLWTELAKHQDPRINGQGELFDSYLYSDPKHRNYYNRLQQGESIKTPSWINKSDEQQSLGTK